MATQIDGEKGNYTVSKVLVRGRRKKRAYEVVRILDADTAALVLAAEAAALSAREELGITQQPRRPVD